MASGNAQWRQTFVGGNSIIEINADADLAADMVIYLSGNVNLSGADFV